MDEDAMGKAISVQHEGNYSRSIAKFPREGDQFITQALF
jgi:hypothetical protein